MLLLYNNDDITKVNCDSKVIAFHTLDCKTFSYAKHLNWTNMLEVGFFCQNCSARFANSIVKLVLNTVICV